MINFKSKTKLLTKLLTIYLLYIYSFLIKKLWIINNINDFKQ